MVHVPEDQLYENTTEWAVFELLSATPAHNFVNKSMNATVVYIVEGMH